MTKNTWQALAAYKKLFWPLSIQRPWLFWDRVVLLVVGMIAS
jgi:hypothetical protein